MIYQHSQIGVTMLLDGVIRFIGTDQPNEIMNTLKSKMSTQIYNV